MHSCHCAALLAVGVLTLPAPAAPDPLACCRTGVPCLLLLWLKSPGHHPGWPGLSSQLLPWGPHLSRLPGCPPGAIQHSTPQPPPTHPPPTTPPDPWLCSVCDLLRHPAARWPLPSPPPTTSPPHLLSPFPWLCSMTSGAAGCSAGPHCPPQQRARRAQPAPSGGRLRRGHPLLHRLRADRGGRRGGGGVGVGQGGVGLGAGVEEGGFVVLGFSPGGRRAPREPPPPQQRRRLRCGESNQHDKVHSSPRRAGARPSDEAWAQ